MKIRKVSINIVTWNSLTYLPFCLTSIFKQNFRDFSVLVIDNGSSDGTIDYIQKNFPEVKILKNTQNLGYSRAHNQGIKLTKSDYVLIMNPDIIITPDYLNNLVRVAELRPNITAFGGKILKFHFTPSELKEIKFTDKIDTVGIQAHKNRSFTNEGENEKDRGQFDKEKEVFGISGGLLFLRRNDLESIRIIDEYFDENFFVYKEDVDLAWRMRLFSLKSLYVAQAVAFHHRQAEAPESKKLKDISRSRRLKSQFINRFSYRNHLFLLVKNEFFINLFWRFPFIFCYELKKFFYLLFFETTTLKIYPEFFRFLPKMWKKRKLILKNKKGMIKQIRNWFHD